MTVRTERMTGGITLVFTLCQALFCTLRMRNLTLPLPQTEALYTEEETEDRRSESKSHSVVSNSLRPHGLNSPWHSPGQNIGVDSLSVLQGIFPTQGLNPDLPHCKWILYQLSHKRSPRILEWIAYPFSSRSFRPWNQNTVSCIAREFFTNWAIREALRFREATSKCETRICIQVGWNPKPKSFPQHMTLFYFSNDDKKRKY